MRMFLRGDSFKDSSCPDCCGCIVITTEQLRVIVDSYPQYRGRGSINIEYPGFKELKRKTYD